MNKVERFLSSIRAEAMIGYDPDHDETCNVCDLYINYDGRVEWYRCKTWLLDNCKIVFGPVKPYPDPLNRVVDKYLADMWKLTVEEATSREMLTDGLVQLDAFIKRQQEAPGTTK